MPLKGGEEQQVLPAISRRNFYVADKGVYFQTPMNKDGESSIQFLNSSTGKVSTITTIAGKNVMPGQGFTVSPDARSISYAQVDSTGSDLMLVRNFR